MRLDGIWVILLDGFLDPFLLLLLDFKLAYQLVCCWKHLLGFHLAVQLAFIWENLLGIHLVIYLSFFLACQLEITFAHGLDPWLDFHLAHWVSCLLLLGSYILLVNTYCFLLYLYLVYIL